MTHSADSDAGPVDLATHDHKIDYLIELRGVYDGWSIGVMTDGCLHNRWSDDEGNALPGYERRYEATERAIDEMLHPSEKCPTPPEEAQKREREPA